MYFLSRAAPVCFMVGFLFFLGCFELGCQYQCRCFSGKTCLRNNPVNSLLTILENLSYFCEDLCAVIGTLRCQMGLHLAFYKT